MDFLIFAAGALFGASALGTVFVFLIHHQVELEQRRVETQFPTYGKRPKVQAANDELYGPEPVKAALELPQGGATGRTEPGWHPRGTPPPARAVPAFLARPRCLLCQQTRLFFAKMLKSRDSTHS